MLHALSAWVSGHKEVVRQLIEAGLKAKRRTTR